MSYIVVYQRADGSSGLEECTTLDLAVVAAERLRNVDSVENPRILKTEEVRFDFRPYYRVEVAEGAVEPSPASTSAASSPGSTFTPAPKSPTPSLSSAAPSSAAPASASAWAAAPAPATVPAESTGSIPDATLTPETTIDPWASADAGPIDYTKGATAPVAPTSETAVAASADPIETAEFPPAPAPSDESMESVAAADDQIDAPAAETAPVSEDEESSWPSRGLFSTPNTTNPAQDPSSTSALAEDVSDAVPPRRGLFGR